MSDTATKLVLPYPPTLNHLRMVVRGRLISTSHARQYEAAVRSIAAVARITPVVGPVRVTVRAYRPRRIGDLDNTLKAAFDSLKGIAWADDSQVVEIHAFRDDDKENPRLELDIQPVEVRP